MSENTVRDGIHDLSQRITVAVNRIGIVAGEIDDLEAKAEDCPQQPYTDTINGRMQELADVVEDLERAVGIITGRL